MNKYADVWECTNQPIEKLLKSMSGFGKFTRYEVNIHTPIIFPYMRKKAIENENFNIYNSIPKFQMLQINIRENGKSLHQKNFKHI